MASHQHLGVDVDHSQGLLQVVAGNVGKLFKLAVCTFKILPGHNLRSYFCKDRDDAGHATI